MTLVTDLLDRFQQLHNDRLLWEEHWWDIARYTLPNAERFDRMFSEGKLAAATTSVVGEPVATKRAVNIYDTTSLWAVDRGAAGTLSLVTPQTGTFHDLTTDDPFGIEPSDEEQRWYERYRDYLFAARANPRSGFWIAHKAAIRCLWAFGTACRFIGESARGASSPISYAFVPISENHLGTNFEGVVDTNFRLFQRSAAQCVARWGARCSAKTIAMASDPKRKDQMVNILHAVYPREEKGGYGNTNKNSPWASCYVDVGEKHLIGESGYWEFPYVVDHWQRNNPAPYAEGPVAIALADIKSLNMLSKQELLGTQQWIKPPIATNDEGQNRLNLNPGAVNAGYVDSSGRLLAQPIITTQRPDFARTVIEARGKNVQTTLYIDLWQALLMLDREVTAAEAMIRASEKADILGPLGSSIQTGLAYLVERETGVIERAGLFERAPALRPPDSLAGKDMGVRFTSPLDKLRRVPELQGMTQLISLVGQISQVFPEAMDKIDFDAAIDEAQEILNAPRKIMVDDDTLAAKRQARAQQGQMAQTIAGAAAAGEAGVAAASGAQAVADSPAASEILKRLAGVARVPA